MFKGVFTPVITVFDEKGNIDFDGNAKVINNLINNGINGILLLGSIGEFFNLTMQERKDFIDFAVRTVNRRVPILIGTGGTIVEEVVELTKYAKSAGADAAVAISPYYFKLDEDSIYRYYAEIAQRVDIPLLLYNFPDRTAVDMSPELVLRLAVNFKNIVGIKDTVDNISHTRKLIRAVKPHRKDFAILSGFDEYLIPNLMAGGDGLIGGLSNITPESFAKLFNAYMESDLKAVAEIQAKINTLMSLYDVSQPFICSIKAAAAVVLRGISPMARKPAALLSTEQNKRVESILSEAGLIN